MKNTFFTVLKMFVLSTLLLSRAMPSKAQKNDKTPLYEAYSQLVGGTWETKGNWANGNPYHQAVTVEKTLNGQIFVVRTQDFIDAKAYEQATRNHGIRAWEEKEGKMKFWEFDVFGNVIKGEVVLVGKDIYHLYEYTNSQGAVLQLADVWQFQDKDTYVFKVCEYTNGKLGKEYLQCLYQRKQQ